MPTNIAWRQKRVPFNLWKLQKKLQATDGLDEYSHGQFEEGIF